jgi:hypothetical protein
MAVFWVVPLCTLIWGYQCLRGLYCLKQQGDGWSSVRKIGRNWSFLGPLAGRTATAIDISIQWALNPPEGVAPSPVKPAMVTFLPHVPWLSVTTAGCCPSTYQVCGPTPEEDPLLPSAREGWPETRCSWCVQATSTVSSNAFHTQEWPNLARDKIWRLHLTLLLVCFFGWLVGWLARLHSSLRWHTHTTGLWNICKLKPIYTALQLTRQPCS